MSAATSRPALALAAAVSALSVIPLAIPDAALPNVPTAAEWGVHAVLFATGGFLWTWAAPRMWAWVFVAGVAVAFGSEWVQDCCVDGRGGEWADALFDLVGLAIGVAAGWALAARVRTVSEPTPR